MDHFDQKILRMLAQNARVSGAEIARKVNLSVPAVTERLRKLGKSGVIDRYTIKLSRSAMALNLMAFVQVWVDHTKSAQLKESICHLPEILECHHIAGDCDLLLKVLVKDTAALEELLVHKIKAHKAITRTSTIIVLNTIKEEINPPIR